MDVPTGWCRPGTCRERYPMCAQCVGDICVRCLKGKKVSGASEGWAGGGAGAGRAAPPRAGHACNAPLRRCAGRCARDWHRPPASTITQALQPLLPCPPPQCKTYCPPVQCRHPDCKPPKYHVPPCPKPCKTCKGHGQRTGTDNYHSFACQPDWHRVQEIEAIARMQQAQAQWAAQLEQWQRQWDAQRLGQTPAQLQASLIQQLAAKQAAARQAGAAAQRVQAARPAQQGAPQQQAQQAQQVEAGSAKPQAAGAQAVQQVQAGAAQPAQQVQVEDGAFKPQAATQQQPFVVEAGAMKG